MALLPGNPRHRAHTCLVPGLLGCLCPCTAAPLPRLGTHIRLWSWRCTDVGRCHKLPIAVPCSSKPEEKPPHFPEHLPGRGACSTRRLGPRISSQMSAHPVPPRANSGHRPCRDQVGTAEVTARLSCPHTSPAAGPGASHCKYLCWRRERARGNGELRVLASHDNPHCYQSRFFRRDLFRLPTGQSRSRLW